MVMALDIVAGETLLIAGAPAGAAVAGAALLIPGEMAKSVETAAEHETSRKNFAATTS